MAAERLSKRQRQILLLMREHGTAAFFGFTRRFTHSVHADGGVIIRCYQTPEYFLRGRGLIEPARSNKPGGWYRLTEAGRARAARLRDAV